MTEELETVESFIVVVNESTSTIASSVEGEKKRI